MTVEPEQKVLREVVLNQLTTGESHAYRMWLPPLVDPTPVNELIARDYDRRPLRIGMGVMDEPRRHRQEVWGIDVSTAAGNIAVGVRESDLTVAHNHMHASPHHLIFGASKSGKTTIAHAIARAICARNSPDQVRFMVADYRSGLLEAVPDTHLLAAGAITRNHTTLEASIKPLAINLTKRLPPAELTPSQLRARSWWTGPDIVLLVDDWHMIVAAGGMMSPMAPLAPLLPAAADIGLHIVVTCQMSQAHRATMDKFVGAAYGAGTPIMFLSGEKQDFPSREILVKKRPPGQAFYVTPDGKEVIQAAYVDPPEEDAFGAPSDGG